MERVEGIDSVNKALEAMRESIEASGGTFKVVLPVCLIKICAAQFF